MCIASVEFVQKGNLFQFLFFPQRKKRAFLSDLSLHFPFNIYIPQWRLLYKLDSYSSLQFGNSYVNIDYIFSDSYYRLYLL